MTKSICAALLGFLILFSAACSTSTVLSTLNLVVITADSFLAVAEADGTLSADTGALIQGYINKVSTAAGYTATELSSSDTNAVKRTRIAEYFAGVIIPSIPGASPKVAIALKEVEVAIDTFLAQMNIQKGAVAQPNISFGFAKQIIHPSFVEQHQLNGIKKHAEQLEKKTAFAGQAVK